MGILIINMYLFSKIFGTMLLDGILVLAPIHHTTLYVRIANIIPPPT
jgi:hypothetical protein